MGKRGRIKHPPGGGRRIKDPGEPQRESSQNSSPVFCLRYLKRGYSLDECTPEQALAFTEKLVKLCQLDWQTIQNSSREGVGHEKMPRAQIKCALPSRVTEDVKELIVFRLPGEGKPRMLGLRHDRVFEVYLIDPAGSAYDH